MKDIKGYEGLYAVTSCGKVWSYKNKKFLKPRPNHKRYLRVNLYKNGKPQDFYIHRLVAEAYLENPSNYDEVSHLDETKTNNCANNLAWVSHSENCNMPLHLERMSKALTGKLINNKPISQYSLDGEFIRTFISATEASKITGIDNSSIGKAANGKLKHAGGFLWGWCNG